MNNIPAGLLPAHLRGRGEEDPQGEDRDQAGGHAHGPEDHRRGRQLA